MQDFLHIRTLFLATSIFGVILFVCMLNILRTRKTYAGFKYWTAATFCYFLGNALIGLRGIIPDLFSIIAANMMVAGTMILAPYGLSRFVDKEDPAWPYLLSTAGVTILVAYWTYLSPDIRARIVIISLMHSVTCLYCLYRLRRDIPTLLHSRNSMLEFFFGLGALWALFRLVYTALFDQNVRSVLHPSPATSISLIIYCVLVSFIAFGLCLLNFQRTEHDLANATDEVKQLTGFLPMCSACKKIRDDQGYWNQVDAYIRTHSKAVCSHSICPECLQRLYPEYCNQPPAQDKKP